MSFIPKEFYPAVMFARYLMREGTHVGLAVYKAAKYYNLDTSDVAAWLNGKKKKENKPHILAGLDELERKSGFTMSMDGRTVMQRIKNA